PIIAVDIPSGLNGNTGEVNGKAVIATETAFLGLPKIGFMMLSGWDHVGKLRYIDFGLPKKYINEAFSDISMLTTDELKPLLPKLRRSRHKYEAGYVVGLTGSPGMSGAALLSADAAIHSGAGIVRILFPQGMQAEFGGNNPEILKMPYLASDVEGIAGLMNRGSATYIGPGIGRKPETFHLLQRLLPLLQKPCVIDADALYWLAESDVDLPENTILTPHRGEMNGLLKVDKDLPLNRDYLDLCAAYAIRKRCTLVLKGGPTFIMDQGDSIKVNPRGDPGMATAGSGDLLTGLIAGLLAQGMTPQNAAAMGVYIHGIAGEYAASEMTSYCMAAGDILYHFPEGFLFYEPT
ncbi:MAG: NAD(P)H-hydrate dehydratase, partial [Parachlamydiaceae bacterium]|nr:NAD(P)H-hydrate dehydratase [Parachlamydiaceae bacterium]